MSAWSRIYAVARRELRIMLQRPIYLVGTFLTLGLSVAFYLTFFGKGMTENLPVGVVDLDHDSYFSRKLGMELSDNQLCEVVVYDDFVSAREDLQRGKIAGFLVVPEGIYKDILTFRRPTFAFYINGLYYIGGTMAYKELLTLANLGNGAIEREFLRARGANEDTIIDKIQPIEVICHSIGNPETNFNYYLSSIMLPQILSMIIILVLVYSLGAEMKFGTSRHLLRTSGGSITIALCGKLLVYTVLFTMLGVSLVLLLYGWCHFPIAGSIWWMILDIFLLVLSSEAVAIFLIGLSPVTRLAMSTGALYSVLGFSFSGFTLPIEQMPRIIQGLAPLFPIRHYYLFYVQNVLYGTGFAGVWKEIVHLMIFLLIPIIIVNRLKKAYINLDYPRN